MLEKIKNVVTIIVLIAFCVSCVFVYQTFMTNKKLEETLKANNKAIKESEQKVLSLNAEIERLTITVNFNKGKAKEFSDLADKYKQDKEKIDKKYRDALASLNNLTPREKDITLQDKLKENNIVCTIDTDKDLIGMDFDNRFNLLLYVENADNIKLKLSMTESEATALRNSIFYQIEQIVNLDGIISTKDKIIAEKDMQFGKSQTNVEALNKNLNLTRLGLYVGTPIVVILTYLLIKYVFK